MRYLILIGSVSATFLSTMGCRSTVESVPQLHSPVSSAVMARQTYENGDVKKFTTDINNHGTYLSEREFMALRTKAMNAALFIPNTDLRGSDKSVELKWKQEHPKTKSFLTANATDEYYSYWRQYCATEMITKTDLLQDSSEESLDALAFYTEILDEEKSRNPALFYYALTKLKGHWSADKVNAVTTRAIEYGQDAVEQSKLTMDKIASTLPKKDLKNKESLAFNYMGEIKEITHQNQLFVQKLNRLR